jgi:hypothetical protein
MDKIKAEQVVAKIRAVLKRQRAGRVDSSSGR